MLDMDHRLTGRCPYPLPVKVYINFIFRPANHIRTDAHVHLSAPVLLADQHPLQPSAVKAAQLHKAGNAHIRQGRRPVPAGLEHGLAQVGRSGDRIPVIHIEIVPPLGLLEIGHGGGKFQPQRVLSGNQELLHRENIGSVHIFCLSHHISVQHNAADGIQAGKFQLLKLPVQSSGIQRKRCLKGTVPFSQGTQGLLVDPIEGVRDFPVFP